MIIFNLLLDFLVVPRVERLNKANLVYQNLYPNIVLGSSRGQGSFLMSAAFDGNGFNYSLPGTENKYWFGVLYDLINDGKQQTIVINVDDTDILDLYKSNLDGDHRAYWRIPKSSFCFNNLSDKTLNKIVDYPFNLFGEGYFLIYQFLRENINETSFNELGSRIEKSKISDEQLERQIRRLRESHEEGILEITKETNNLLKSLELNNQQVDMNKRDTVIFISLPSLAFDKNEVFNYLEKRWSNVDNFKFLDLEDSFKNYDSFVDAQHLTYSSALFISKQLYDFLH